MTRSVNKLIGSLAFTLILAIAPARGIGNTMNEADVTIIAPVNGYTLTGEGLLRFSSLAFDGNGKIVGIGGDDIAEGFPGASLVDGESRTVLPGLIDSHGHIAGLGAALQMVNLFNVPSKQEALARIKAQDKKYPGQQWIVGRGWNQVLWTVREFPTAADIDAVVADRPTWMRRVDGHAGWANSQALRLAGINDETLDPPGGKILRDRQGHATGVLIDRAMGLVERVIPPLTKDDIRTHIRNAGEQLIAEGISSAHDPGVDVTTIEVYLSMADAGELPVRSYVMISGAGANLDAIGKPIRGYGNDFVTVAAVKIYDDGALGSRGAALLEPYSDDPENSGLLFADAVALAADVRKSNAAGFQANIHAIGDRANRAALDAFDEVQGGKPSPLRNRIEHAQVIALEDIPRFAQLGVIAAMQATHATSDMNMAEDRVGPERIKGAYAWRKLLDSGAVIAGGSDFPVEYSNPFLGLYASVTRQDRDQLPDGGWYANEALSREEALDTFTRAAAYAAHQEDRLGTLEPGKWADFIVIDRDYFAVPESEIDDIQVLETWIGGKRVYARPTENQDND